MELRKIKLNEVSVEVLTEPEGLSPYTLFEDNLETDLESIHWIKSELKNGNEWAWCTVIVKVSWNGFAGRDLLGGCSYQNEEAFKSDGYYEDMLDSAVDDLNKNIVATFENIKPLIEV